MPSFDVVSRLDYQEIDNAIGNATREITTRYDFKGSDTSIEKKENCIVVTTDDEMKAGQVNDMLVTHFVRRKVDPLCLKKKELEKAGGNKIRQSYDLIEGIEQSLCKKIIADIKSSKLKVQVKINGNELRVDGKKKDDLQNVMQLIEESNIGIPVQFINFRD
ncbi:YajQ family cyclic di-GMP-binding protein [Pelagibacteraceae bacterium]|nr:YajQ family cyclic di-GMP-binding protein [Pelagibacteraceae bacterium]